MAWNASVICDITVPAFLPPSLNDAPEPTESGQPWWNFQIGDNKWQPVPTWQELAEGLLSYEEPVEQLLELRSRLVGAITGYGFLPQGMDLKRAAYSVGLLRTA